MISLLHKFAQKLQERCHRMTDEGQRSEMTKIDALLIITAAILVFHGVTGSFRRCCSTRAFAMVAFAAYNLTPAVIMYTLGLIQTAHFCSIHLPIWATYLVVILENVDSYMEDIERWKSFKVESAAKCIMTSWMIASYVVLVGPMMSILFVILFLKLDERARALMMASNSVMQENYKHIADYMRTEHQCRDSSDEDPATMSGYSYLVRGARDAKVPSLCLKKRRNLWNDGEVPADVWNVGEVPDYRPVMKITDEAITIEKVWRCEGRLLSVSGGDPDGRLKDLCLSFSLFNFICLRFIGYSLPQEAHGKLWRLISHMLFEENDYERVFRVIEVELALLFDLFYTKNPVNLHLRRSVYRLLLLPIVAVVPLVLLYYTLWSGDGFTTVVTLLLMTSILVVEFTQFGIMIFSEWAKVTYICKYVRNKWWERNRCAGKLIEIMCRVWLVKPWGRQLRQYSLLKSYSYSPSKWIYNRFTTAYLDQKRNGQKQIAPTNLSKQVKKAIAQSLGKDFTGYLENGRASLRSNELYDELSWACDLNTTTQVIMVWHIATTFCEYQVPCTQPSQEQRGDFGIATKLSQYLAYLVVFAPKLLPGHPCMTEFIFGCAIRETRYILGGSSASMEERMQKLKMIIDYEQCEQMIVAQGARLGMQLVNVASEGRIWKVLADFWADMMLYVAPSNDTAAHAKYLTTGGEFVTHVWVLVSHAGITRDPYSGE